MKSKILDYNKLKKEWYKRLENSGFQDIEQDEDNLKSWSVSKGVRNRNNGASAQQVLENREARETYYRLAGQFLHDYRFTSRTDRLIWEKHSDGESIRDIVKILALHGIKTTKNPVNEVIKTLRDIMLGYLKK